MISCTPTKRSIADKGVPKLELGHEGGGGTAPALACRGSCASRRAAGLAVRGSSGIFAGMTTLDDSGRIAVDPAVCSGRPVVKGTRIAVQTVLEFLGAGDGIADVLEEYPALTREDVLACLQFSSRLMGNHFTFLQVA